MHPTLGRPRHSCGFAPLIDGMACCFIGALSLGLIPDGIKTNGVAIHPMIEHSANLNMDTAYLAVLTGFIFCAAECAISKLAELYFTHELAAWTPFTFEGARELLRLGICTIGISCSAVIVAAVCNTVATSRFAIIANLSIGDFAQIGLGVAFIVLSVVFRYGAESFTERQAPNGA